jgi:hypothetical protein
MPWEEGTVSRGLTNTQKCHGISHGRLGCYEWEQRYASNDSICQFSLPVEMQPNVEYIERELEAWRTVYATSCKLHISIRFDLLLGLEVVEKDRSLLRLLTPILDDNARAVDNFASVALAVQHAC